MEKPKLFMSIREIAKTGLISEYTLRRLVKENKINCIYSGNKCLINYQTLEEQLNHLGGSNHES